MCQTSREPKNRGSRATVGERCDHPDCDGYLRYNTDTFPESVACSSNPLHFRITTQSDMERQLELTSDLSCPSFA